MSDVVSEIKEHDDMVGASMGYRSFDADEEKPEPEAEEPEEEVEENEEEADDGDGESEDDVAEEEDEKEFKLPGTSPELEEERKNLQRVFNERMTEVSGLRMKAQLADAINENPEAVIKNLAAQYGVNMVATETKEVKKELDLEGLAPGEKESLPKFIARVMDKVLDARESKKPPVVKQQADTSVKEEVEKTLKYIQKTYSDWGIYEKRMTSLVMKHPSLYKDPDELYKLAKGSYSNPQDKAKTKKAKSKAGKKKVSSGERGRAPVITTPKGKKVPFNVAWDRAMREASK